MTIVRAEHEASRLLRLWRILNPEDIDVEDIAFLCGALARDVQLQGAEARLVRVEENAIISVSQEVGEPARRRFDIAHEIGHLRLHPNNNALVLCTEDDVEVRGFSDSRPDDQELEANAFAAELLMPRFMFEPRCVKRPPSFGLIESLAGTFRTSLSATARHYIKYTKERCAVVFSADGRIRSCVKSDDFGYWIVGDLDKYSLAFDYFQGKSLPSRAESVDASTWLEGRFVNDAMIKEESRALPRYGVVISLLWIDRPIDIDQDDWDDSETFTPDGRYWRRD